MAKPWVKGRFWDFKERLKGIKPRNTNKTDYMYVVVDKK